MEAYFEKLVKDGKNTVESLIKWLKEAKVIDGVKVTEEMARAVFAEVSDPKNVNLDQFKEALTKLASGQNKNFDEYSKMLSAEAPKLLNVLKAGVSAFKDAFSKKVMEALYETLKSGGKTSVDSIIQWMKDAKIIDGIKVTEEKARGMFNDVVDKQNVNLENFKEALTKIASEQKKNIDDLCKTLTAEAPRFLDALKAGACAFKDTLTKKD